jgi:Na+/proline symporter
VDAAEARTRRLASSLAGQTVSDVNYIFPSYIVDRLRGGLAGLIIAVIFAAAMSTLAGELNSLATATMVDFYSRFVRVGGRPGADLLASRVFTAFWGLFAGLVAMKAGQLGSAIEVVNRFGSYFYGSILGVFGLAVLTPRATARGAFYGLFAGMATVFCVSQLTSVAFLWFNVIGAVTVFAAGLLITALAPGERPVGDTRS